MFAQAAAIAGIPTAATIAFLIAGWLPGRPAVALLAICWICAYAFVAVLRRDMQILSGEVRRIAVHEAPPATRATDEPVFLTALSRELDTLSRVVAPRAAMAEQLRRTDTLILERLPDPLIVLAADRSVRRANAAARSVYGGDIGAVLRHPDLLGALDRSLTSGAVQTTALRLPVPVERDVQIAVVPLDPPLSDGGRVIIVLSDRTRERLVERMRADFVANVSHELRTPLASLIGFIETLRGPAADDPPAQRRFLGIMAEQGARMNRLIDDLLSLSRIELTEHQSPSDTVRLKDVIDTIIASFEPRMSARAARFDIDIPADLPTLTADPDQIAQVLQNLLDNALKYGRDGGVITLSVTTPRAGSRWPARPGALIAVSDQGMGIPREHIPRLTERFYRVDKGRSRSVGGTGLGLAIIKHIVNRHRGQLVIESEVGVGTTVSIWLPLAQPVTGTEPPPSD